MRTGIPQATRAVTKLLRSLVVGPVPKLFDVAYYRRTYPDVAASGIDPYLHYVRRGAAQDRNPSADFDTAFYKRQSGRTKLDPVRHYLTSGAAAGFDPSPAFSTLMYLTRYPDVARSGINPLVHYLTNGRAERRLASPSSSEPGRWAVLQGVPDAHLWPYPSASGPRFALRLLRHVPIEACPLRAPRICLMLNLDGAEIAGLMHGLANFAAGAQDAVGYEIDTATRLHPPSPTLILALEHCFHGERNAAGEVLLRYAEARVWDPVHETPRLTACFPAGCLALRDR